MPPIGAYPSCVDNDPFAYLVLAASIATLIYGGYIVFFAKHPDDKEKKD